VEDRLADMTPAPARHLREDHLYAEARVLRGHDPRWLHHWPVLERVRALKAEEGKDLWLVSGETLAHSLLPEIGRIVLKQNRSVIGSGIPLFDGPFQPHMFRPVDETCSTQACASSLTTAPETALTDSA